MLAGLELIANYSRDNRSWDNKARFRYGRIRQGRYGVDSLKFRSLEDKIELSTKYGYRAFGAYYISFSGNFKSQFGKIYDWEGDTKKEKISDFMSPGYLNFSLGLDYKPDENTTLFLSPIASKTTFVLDEMKSIKSKYGVDTTMNFRNELGARFKAAHKMKIWGDIEMVNELELFSNYLEKPQNIDLDWELKMFFPVNRFIRATIQVNYIYDDDTKVPRYKKEKGIEVKDEESPGGQFREMLTIGMRAKF